MSMKVELKNATGELISLPVLPKDTFRDLKDRMLTETGNILDLNNIDPNDKGMIADDELNVFEFFGQVGIEDEDDTSELLPCCSVPGCSSSMGLHPEKTFFSFPTEDDVRREWLLLCQREDLMDKDSDYMREHHAICSDHFEEEHFDSSAKESLKDSAIPTLFQGTILPDDLPMDDIHITSATSIMGDEPMIIKMEPDVMDEEDEEDEDLLDDGDDLLSDESEEEWESEDDTRPSTGRMCRLCGRTAAEMVYIFSPAGRELGLEIKINACLPVWVKKSDPLPKQLCMSCLCKLNTVHEFAEECLRAEIQLANLNKHKYFSTPDSKIDSSASLQKVEPKNNNNQENENSACCPLCWEGSVVIKDKHQCEFVDKDSPADESPEIVTDEEVLDEKQSVAELEAVLSENTSSLQPPSKPKVVTDTHGNQFIVIGNGNEWWNEGTLVDSNDVEVETIVPDQVLDDDIYQSTVCRVCNEVFPNIDTCLEHSKIHAEPNLFPCSLCDLCYTTEEDTEAHFAEHKAEELKRNSLRALKRLPCLTCGRRFNNKRTFDEHACFPRAAKPFKCTVCHNAYQTMERLAFHSRFHQGAVANLCVLCEKQFDNESSLYYHTRMVHDGERKFSCDVCGKRFHSNARLVGHRRVHSGERPFECEVCGRRFYDKETLKSHYVTHMANKPFQCQICGVYCARKTMLRLHMDTHHMGTRTPRRVPSLIHYACRVCDETFTSSFDVVNHRLMHAKIADSDSHTCEYCGIVCMTLKSLSVHQKRDHPNEKPFVCTLCENTSRTLYEARLHRKTHSLEEFRSKAKVKAMIEVGERKLFICEACGKTYPDKRTLSVHFKSCHQKELLYECEFCQKRFADNQRLTIHRRLHTGEKPYECPVCLKRFSQSSALSTHALLHSGIKPHSCDLCPKSFRIKADRDNHRRTHTGEKPFKCEYCFKAFRTGQVYYQHRMIHTDDRRFPCDVCGRRFKRSHTLVCHKRIHTGEKPNICDICGKGFRQRTDMRKHRALHQM